MACVMVRYKVKADQADTNVGFIKKVFEELEQSGPEGIRYASFQLDDGVSFVHIASIDANPNPLPQAAAFKAFQAGLKDRCEEMPVVTPLTTEVGNYGLVR